MISRKIFSACFVLLFATPAFAEVDTSYWCDLLLGDWRGIYELDGRRIYQYDSALDEDGSIIVDFYYFDTESTDRHEGTWLCEGDIISTSMVTARGEAFIFQYQIMDIDQDSMTYEMISPEGVFDKFHSNRVGARIMNPEIFGQ